MRTLAFLLLLLLAVPPTASAEPLEGTFQSRGTTHLAGALDLEWDLAGAFLEPPPGATLDLLLRDAELTLVSIPYHDTSIPTPGEPHRTYGHEPTEEVLWRGAGSGSLRFVADGLSTVRVLPVENLTARAEAGSVHLDPAGSPWRPTHHHEPTPLENQRLVAGIPVYPDGPHTLARSDGTLSLRDRVHLALDGGNATWNGHPLRTGMQPDPSQSFTEPTTGLSRQAYNDVVLVGTARVVAVSVDGADWMLAARGVDGTLDGAAEWRGVTGSVRLNGTRLPSDPTTLQAEGTLGVRSDLQARSATWHLDGEATSVAVDRTAVLGTAATAGASLLLLALLLEPVRALLADLLARVLPLRLLSRDGDASRRRILAVVHEHQPVRLAELAEHTGLSRSTLRHHTRLLLRQGVLQAHEAGQRNRTLMLNGGSLRFQVRTLAGEVAADAALSVCHGHPVRRALLDRLRHGPAAADVLLEHLAEAGVPVARSTLSHHLQRMADAGAVASKQDGSRKLYHLCLDAGGIRTEQYRRYLAGHGLTELVRALARHPELDRAAVAALVRDVPHAPDADGLVALSVLEPRGDRFRLTPPLAELARRLGGAS